PRRIREIRPFPGKGRWPAVQEIFVHIQQYIIPAGADAQGVQRHRDVAIFYSHDGDQPDDSKIDPSGGGIYDQLLDLPEGLASAVSYQLSNQTVYRPIAQTHKYLLFSY